MKAEERPRCPEVFLLLHKDSPATTSACLLVGGHHGAHKAKGKNGMVNWKRRRRPAEEINDRIVKPDAPGENSRHTIRKHSAGRTSNKPHGEAAYRLDRR